MIKACELKKSSVIDIDGTPHIIQNITQQSPTARGGGTIYKVRFRNISTNQKVDQTYRSEDALQETTYDTNEVQYLYKDGDRYNFMDLTSYEQFELMEEDIEDCLPFLMEDMEGIIAMVSKARKGMSDQVKALSKVDGVSFADVLWYDTKVKFSSEYGKQTNGDSSGRSGGRNSAANEREWQGQLVREGLERAERHQSLKRQGRQFEQSDRWNAERRSKKQEGHSRCRSICGRTVRACADAAVDHGTFR